MPIIRAPQEMLESGVYVDLEPAVDRRFLLKCEGFNFAGSIKLRSAAGLVAAAERAGRLRPDSVLIESSSGNLGLAVGVIAADRGLRFVCVTDPRCGLGTVSLMRALGVEVVVVDEPDPVGGFLKSRLDHVRSRCAADPRYVWLDQYANPANWRAHHDLTAATVAADHPELDVLFVGAGTGGTVMGCARYFQAAGGRTKVVAVDAAGSVSFGGPPGARLIPGLGTGVRPPLIDPSLVDDVVYVAEVDTVRCCRALARRGLLLGGSTGTVVSGAMSWLAAHDPDRRLSAVAVAPDLADRYAHTVYDDEWVLVHFGAAALEPLDLAAEQWPRLTAERQPRLRRSGAPTFR
ncbi:2,3-diaminopropionate biosynthesis protein SbnA [Actinophytocola sp.]|uniref:2,3-diaminopropionate biosynthesis protein SbnA n=1 Tax=Actinophytocola sp. TaxID=1872138 RepID=UPI00389A4973